MEFHFLGGAMEIGGSCIYVRIAGKGILMDCGIRQSGTKDPIPDFRTVQENGGVDAILISHAHMDHIGTLPIISRAYPAAHIYMTAMTADLTQVLLYDSLKIMNSREDEIPHYSQQDVLDMLKRIRTVGYQTPCPLFEGFTLTCYPAGHIAGAACLYLVTEEGSLFYSGDFSAFSQRTIEGIRIPRLRPDVAILESTYGSRLHANRQVEEKRLTELVGECVRQKKKVLIPAFALGRAQEVLLLLRGAIQNQEIPPVPVYVDGMVRDINRMYTRNPTYLKNSLGRRILKGIEPFYTEEIRAVAPSQDRAALLSESGPMVLLSSSGMLTGGPSAQYAKALAPSENACIIITGYQDEESPGRQLLNLLENPDAGTLTVNGSMVPVKCHVEQVGLSAHGDKSEITALLERLSPRHVFLVHGNPEVIQELGGELAAADYRRQVYLPQCGQSYELSLHAKRKQLSSQLPHTMGMENPFTREGEKLLWDFWQKHYPGKTFSLWQVASIWHGKMASVEDSILQNMQRILLESPYFSLNPKRLFLFEANTPEDIAQALAPKEMTQQDLAERIRDIFSDFSYRKINFHNDRREILLQFDYPDAQNGEAFSAKAERFAAQWGWTVRLNPSMNHNAALLLLTSLFGERLSKTSYYPERKCYAVTLLPEKGALGDDHPGRPTCLTEKTTPGHSSTAETDTQAAEKFQAETGWALEINGKNLAGRSLCGASQTGPEQMSRETDHFIPDSSKTQSTEQNLAFSCIDQTFADLPHSPDKKSLKQDSQGRYLEVSFTSPMLGRRYHEQLQVLSNQTGWRIRIADKVNQNELFKAAQLLCIKYGLTTVKNPSYLPAQKALQLKLQAAAAPEIQEKFMTEFQEKTGCSCTFTGC